MHLFIYNSYINLNFATSFIISSKNFSLAASLPMDLENLLQQGPRFFVMKIKSEEDLKRTQTKKEWGTNEVGCALLERAYSNGQPVLLFFSTNGSKAFCGVAQMISPVSYLSSTRTSCSISSAITSATHEPQGAQDPPDPSWGGTFAIRWLIIKKVPNKQFLDLLVTPKQPFGQRPDMSEIPLEVAKQALQIMTDYDSRARQTTSQTKIPATANSQVIVPCMDSCNM